MKKVLFLMAVCALAFAACQKQNEQATKVYSIDEINAQADSLVNDTISFEGICAHLCKHGGTKAFLMGSDESQILMVAAAEAGNFQPECLNSVVRVSGVIHAIEIEPEGGCGSEGGCLKHGEGDNGCETEAKAIKAYYAEAISYEVVE